MYPRLQTFYVHLAIRVLASVFSVAGAMIGVELRAQEAPEFHAYRLSHGSPTEARRMLAELLGPEAANTKIIADEEGSNLLVSGSTATQKLAGQLVNQMNASSAEPATEKPALTVKTYACEPAFFDQQLKTIRNSISSAARVSSDRSRHQIVLAAPAADHKIAEKLLAKTNPKPKPLFDSPNDWIPRNENAELAHRAAGQNGRATSIAQIDEINSSDLQRFPSRAHIANDAAKNAGFAATTDAAQHSLTFHFSNIPIDDAKAGIQRLLGARIRQLETHRLYFDTDDERHVDLTFDKASSTCQLEGSRDLVLQVASVLQQFEDARDKNTDVTIRFLPLTNVDPEVLNRAIILWRKSARKAEPPDEKLNESQGSMSRRHNNVRLAAFQQIPGEPAIPIDGNNQMDDAKVTSPADPAQNNSLRRPSSDVNVEPLPDLDVLILRGRDPDVEELTRIIQEIERLSAETAPEIDVVYLQNVQGEALQALVTKVLDDLTGPLQGRVSITPLVKPNALLLIGWGEAVTAAKKLIAKLDEAVEPQTQMEIFALKNAAANRVETTVKEFLGKRGGLGATANITADPRTNSLIVNAAPRDLKEVARLIERLDAGKSESVNQARIIQLKNALAADVSQTITAAITAARGGVGTQRSAALEMLMTGPDGTSVAASGLLDDVKLTPDPRTNRIFITGPPDSLPLVEQLITSFDESPAASAQIKVFHITNGDASDLVQVLRSLFPEAAAISNVPQLATAEGETSLVPVRFSVDIRTNSIISTGTSGDLQIVEALLLRLDETDSQERVNEVYRLKNSPALDVANAVNNFLRSERIVNQAAPGRQNPFTQIESEVVVVPEPVGNALIISATPRYFKQIMELVEGLDAQPPQVMIQVILAEVSLDNRNEFGVELGLQDSLLFDRSLLGSILTPGYNFNNQPLGNANTPASLASRGNVGGQALSHFSVGRTSSDTGYGGLVLSASSENVSVLLRAMNQSQAVEILSRPQVMTLDNQPAFIQVGQRVPQITASTISQVGQSNSITPTNVGLILGVTPRISPEGMVVMEIDAEKSEVGPEAEGIPVSISSTGNVVRSPRINITTAQTTVSAASGQTIVIGGLITSSNASIQRRVPWLSDVPLVGNLFRYDGNSHSRKELLIILTPNVVRGRSEAEYIKQVEMARMSWISGDIFNWMNTDCDVTGQLDSNAIPTIYPDKTPGAESFEQIVPLTPPPVSDSEPKAPYDDQSTSAAPPTKIIVPEWKIESGNDLDGDHGIQQMSFSSSASTKKTTSPSKPTVNKSRTKSTTEAVQPHDAKEKTASKQPEPKTKPKSKLLWPSRVLSGAEN